MSSVLDCTRNPRRVDISRGVGFLFFVRVVDGVTNSEYRYVGKATRGVSALEDYRRNIQKVFAGRPRRTTRGQEKFRAVHLALAKACEHEWEYEIYPLENVAVSDLDSVRAQRIAELGCNLNSAASWSVQDYASLSISDLL